MVTMLLGHTTKMKELGTFCLAFGCNCKLLPKHRSFDFTNYAATFYDPTITLQHKKPDLNLCRFRSRVFLKMNNEKFQ